ncbi:MAG TPA: hypothetical protein VL017_08665, partial [Devosia sp.]|nr:hypothetical protein [Devosia sp.]
AHPIHTVYRPRLGAGSGKTEGKIKEIELRIAMPAPEPITVLPGRVPGKTWKRKPAYKRIRTAKTPAKVDNVVPLSNPTPAIASNATESART